MKIFYSVDELIKFINNNEELYYSNSNEVREVINKNGNGFYCLDFGSRGEVDFSYVENFVEDLTYFEKKNKMTIDIISDNSLIIPEYIINVQNKSKKTIELVEHYEKLKNLETQNKEDKISQKKEVKKIKKNYKKKKYYKKTK